MASCVFVIINSGNGLLPDGTKPLPEPMIIKYVSQLNEISLNILKISVTKYNRNHVFKMSNISSGHNDLTRHWGRVTHICVSKLTIMGSDNGLSPDRRQAIIWTNAGILLIGPLETNFSEILIEIHTFSFKKMHLKMSSGKWRPFCLGLNVLNRSIQTTQRINNCWYAWLIVTHYGSELTLAQVMACCLMAPSQYLNQCWHKWSSVAFTWEQFHSECPS